MSNPHRKISDATIKTAFLIIAAGGTGRNGALRFRQYAPLASDRPFSDMLISIDTDRTADAHDPTGKPTSLLGAVDAHVNIALTREDISRIKANPERYGRVASELVTKRPHLLDPEALEHGSRTTRMITQLAATCHQQRIFDALEVGCSRLAASGPVGAIQPIVMASGGGGCGSALLTLMSIILTGPRYQQAFAPGLADMIQKPILLVAEPYAFAAANTDDSRHAILANAFATRLEIALLSRAQRVLLALRLGHGNNRGTRFDHLDDVYAALGATAFMLASKFGYVTARGVDTFLKDMHIRRYNGADVPESFVPAELQPSYSARATRRRPRPDDLVNGVRLPGQPTPPSPLGYRNLNGFTNREIS